LLFLLASLCTSIEQKDASQNEVGALSFMPRRNQNLWAGEAFSGFELKLTFKKEPISFAGVKMKPFFSGAPKELSERVGVVV